MVQAEPRMATRMLRTTDKGSNLGSELLTGIQARGLWTNRILAHTMSGARYGPPTDRPAAEGSVEPRMASDAPKRGAPSRRKLGRRGQRRGRLAGASPDAGRLQQLSPRGP